MDRATNIIDNNTATTATAVEGSAFAKEIDAFLAANDRNNPKNFSDFINSYKEKYQLTLPALSKAWKIDENTIHSWLYKTPQPTPSRVTLDHLTTHFHLSPAQEINLWTIAKGDLSLPTIEKIAFSVTKKNASPVIPDPETACVERTKIWDKLMQRTGLSLDKLASLCGLADRNVQAIHAGKQKFQKPESALKIGRVFSPNDEKIAKQIGRIFLGIPREFPAEELAHSLITGSIDSCTFLALTRLQKFHTNQEAADAIGVSLTTYNPWERTPKTIRWRDKTTNLAVYSGIAPNHPLYNPLIETLSGLRQITYSPDILQAALKGDMSRQEALKSLRACHNLKMDDIALTLNITKSSYADYEREGKIPNINVLPLMNALYIPSKDWPLFVAAFAPDFQLPTSPDTTIAAAAGTYQAPLQTQPRPMKDIMHEMMRERAISLPDQIGSEASKMGINIKPTRIKLLLEGKTAPTMIEQTALIQVMQPNEHLKREYTDRAKIMNEPKPSKT